MKNEILIFSMKIARDLMQQQRFSAIDIRPNNKFKGSSIVVFKETEELKRYLLDIHNIAI